jgi:hypothetical protein
MIRKFFPSAVLFLCGFVFLPNARAQFTTVTATVTDPNGIPYSGGVMTAILVPATSGGYTLAGKPYSGQVGPVALDATGKFSVNFGDVTQITPASAQWQITIDSSAATILPSLGTGPQSFTYTSSGTTISGSSPVNLTSALNALAPKLTNFVGSGTGTVTSLAATSPIVVTPNPITATGTISCPTCNTGAVGTSSSGQSLANVGGSVAGANTITWTRLGAVLGTPFSNGASSLQEPSCFVQTSPQVVNTNYSQVVGCLYTYQAGQIYYSEAPTPQGPFSVYGQVLSNAGCASNVLTISGQLVMFASAGRLDIHRYHSTTHGITWVDDGAVITHNGQSWYSQQACNSSVLVVGGTCYLWFDGSAGSNQYSQGVATGNATCAANSFTENAGDPAIPFSELDGGGPFVFNDGTNFWQWELGQTGTSNAYPSWIYFTELNPNGIGTPSPHTHTLILTPKAADEGYNNTANAGFNSQLADPFLFEWPYAQGDSRNSTYLYYASCAANCNSPSAQEFTMKVAVIPLPMKSIVQMTQVDTGPQYNYLGWIFTDGISSNTQLPVPAIFDNGNRPNSGNPLGMGNDWTAIYGNVLAQIVSKQFEPIGSGSRPINLRVQPTADQFSTVQLIAAAATSNIGAIVRGSPIDVTFYECVTVNALGVSQTMLIRKFVHGSGFTTVASQTAVTPNINDWMVFTAQGSNLKCIIYDPAGNITISGTDSSIATGLPGMTVVDATPSNAILANWSGGSINGSGSDATQQTQIWSLPQLFEQAVLQPYLVANLPSASSVKSGTTVVVTDATTFTVGTCTGGGSDTMLAVSNGTSWSCH